MISSLLRADVQRLPRRSESVPHTYGATAEDSDDGGDGKARLIIPSVDFFLIQCRLTRKRVTLLEGVRIRFLHSADDPRPVAGPASVSVSDR